jgi:hypothetical protein
LHQPSWSNGNEYHYRTYQQKKHISLAVFGPSQVQARVRLKNNQFSSLKDPLSDPDIFQIAEVQMLIELIDKLAFQEQNGVEKH